MSIVERIENIFLWSFVSNRVNISWWLYREEQYWMESEINDLFIPIVGFGKQWVTIRLPFFLML